MRPTHGAAGPIAGLIVLGGLIAAALPTVDAAAEPPPSPTRLPTPEAVAVALPGGEGGIGFDDLVFSPSLRRVLVPAGRTGNLDLVDPDSRRVSAFSGFSSRRGFASGHGDGTTSADFGGGRLFAIDRTALELVVLDPADGRALGRTELASGPDYVRWVEPTKEIWVTEPDEDRLEVFSVRATGDPAPHHTAFVAVPGGPESLVIDPSRGRAFTHLWSGATVALDLSTRAIVARWPNGCQGSRGIALDQARGFLFVGCAEGRATVLDVEHGGVRVGTLDGPPGVDIVGYDTTLRHLYVPASRSGTMAIVGVAPSGELTRLATVETSRGAHCVVADDRHQAWVCDPDHGQLLLVADSLPAFDGRTAP